MVARVHLTCSRWSQSEASVQSFIDTVGDADNYSRRLSARFPGIHFTVCPKADSLYPIVSVASIAAKVTRDRCPTLLDGETGSGYPSDPTCQKWLQENTDRVFGYPDNVRCVHHADLCRSSFSQLLLFAPAEVVS